MSYDTYNIVLNIHVGFNIETYKVNKCQQSSATDISFRGVILNEKYSDGNKIIRKLNMALSVYSINAVEFNSHNHLIARY